MRSQVQQGPQLVKGYYTRRSGTKVSGHRVRQAGFYPGRIRSGRYHACGCTPSAWRRSIWASGTPARMNAMRPSNASYPWGIPGAVLLGDEVLAKKMAQGTARNRWSGEISGIWSGFARSPRSHPPGSARRARRSPWSPPTLAEDLESRPGQCSTDRHHRAAVPGFIRFLPSPEKWHARFASAEVLLLRQRTAAGQRLARARFENLVATHLLKRLTISRLVGIGWSFATSDKKVMRSISRCCGSASR